MEHKGIVTMWLWLRISKFKNILYNWFLQQNWKVPKYGRLGEQRYIVSVENWMVLKIERHLRRNIGQTGELIHVKIKAGNVNSFGSCSFHHHHRCLEEVCGVPQGLLFFVRKDRRDVDFIDCTSYHQPLPLVHTSCPDWAPRPHCSYITSCSLASRTWPSPSCPLQTRSRWWYHISCSRHPTYVLFSFSLSN